MALSLILLPDLGRPPSRSGGRTGRPVWFPKQHRSEPGLCRGRSGVARTQAQAPLRPPQPGALAGSPWAGDWG